MAVSCSVTPTSRVIVLLSNDTAETAISVLVSPPLAGLEHDAYNIADPIILITKIILFVCFLEKFNMSKPPLIYFINFNTAIRCLVKIVIAKRIAPPAKVSYTQ
ncbi:MAG: hypothetical protein WHT84_02325 [Breznakiellaceae bacterium]